MGNIARAGQAECRSVGLDAEIGREHFISTTWKTRTGMPLYKLNDILIFYKHLHQEQSNPSYLANSRSSSVHIIKWFNRDKSHSQTHRTHENTQAQRKSSQVYFSSLISFHSIHPLPIFSSLNAIYPPHPILPKTPSPNPPSSPIHQSQARGRLREHHRYPKETKKHKSE